MNVNQITTSDPRYYSISSPAMLPSISNNSSPSSGANRYNSTTPLPPLSSILSQINVLPTPLPSSTSQIPSNNYYNDKTQPHTNYYYNPQPTTNSMSTLSTPPIMSLPPTSSIVHPVPSQMYHHSDVSAPMPVQIPVPNILKRESHSPLSSTSSIASSSSASSISSLSPSTQSFNHSQIVEQVRSPTNNSMVINNNKTNNIEDITANSITDDSNDEDNELDENKKNEMQLMNMSSFSVKRSRKYNCFVCDKSFTTSGHLARHTRIHTGERNHICPFDGCTARFSRQDNCMQHYKTHLKSNKKRKRSRIYH